ncbi:MAG TPA: aminoglycoside phosphotransferase family protein [Ktedonobacteraceae bacterium]|nr:aminoglycoside phosphotransferase family protein [Ktedonobacteraceae bacterium]
MTRTDYPVPERVRLRAEQSSPQTRQWLKDLPGLLADLEQVWELSIGQPLSGGSAAYVAPVTTANGNAIIKIAMPSQPGSYGFQQEMETLLRADGHGYAHVFKFDFERRALLLELLGRSMQEQQLKPQQVITLLCKTLQYAWCVPPGANQTINTLEHKALALDQLIRKLWDNLEQPCSQDIISQALTFARRRLDAFDLQRCVVVHGDPHPANALLARTPRAGSESGYVFVDPEGFLCEPEYDLGVVLRGWNEELLAASDPLALAHRYCQLLARESGLNEAAIWEWGFIERVSSGLYVTAYGSSEYGQPFFRAAQCLLETQNEVK